MESGSQLLIVRTLLLLFLYLREKHIPYLESRFIGVRLFIYSMNLFVGTVPSRYQVRASVEGLLVSEDSNLVIPWSIPTATNNHERVIFPREIIMNRLELDFDSPVGISFTTGLSKRVPLFVRIPVRALNFISR